MQHNPILDANLDCISKYNPELCKKLLKISELKNRISFSETVVQEPNMVYNDFMLHNMQGAENEAKQIFEKTNNHSLMLHVVYGFGLGYLFQQFANNSLGIVLLYEPNIEILAATLEVADFSKELSKPNVFIFSDYSNFVSMYNRQFVKGANTTISFLPSYNKLFNQDIKEFAYKLNWEMGRIIIDNNYIENRLIISFQNLFNNIKYLVKEKPITELKDVFLNKTAVIVSAGPTLDNNIDTIKQNRDKFVLISVGNAVRTLCLNGITPDFVTIVDMCNCTSQIENLDLQNSNLIIEPISNTELHYANFKNIFSYPSNINYANTLWAELNGIDSTNLVSLGTVSYMAMYSAVIFGCKDIILVGQDFAYIDGKCYTSGSKQNIIKYKVNQKTNEIIIDTDINKLKDALFAENSDVSEEEKLKTAKIRLSMIKNNLITVDGIKGNKLPTTVDYASFIIQFENFAQKFKDKLNLYNTSLVGANIKGFKNISLNDALKNKEKIEIPDLNINYKYDIKKILNKLNAEHDCIKSSISFLSVKDKIINKIDKNPLTNNFDNVELINSLKQLTCLYIDFTEIYCNKSKLVKNLQAPFKINVEPELRKAHFQKTNSSALDVYKTLKIYLNSVSDMLKNFDEIILKEKDNLNEMFNTKG